MLSLVLFTVLFASAFGEPCTDGSSSELLLSLSKALLRSLETTEALPNPSVHIALRLSQHHNLVKESENLHKLTTSLHNHLQSSLSSAPSVSGLLALYTLALKSSCYDLNTVTFSVNSKTESLLSHLKEQMRKEKENTVYNLRPLTNYYQYSLGVLALCVSSVRVDHHINNKLIQAVEHDHLKHGTADSVDTLAMAGMALQCVKDSGAHALNTAHLNSALSKIQQKLLAAQRPDGHIGNEFSTGLAIQALLAMGHQVSDCAASMVAMRTDARNNLYHNPMAVSQILPALHHKSYLALKNMQCLGEDDSLVLEPLVDPEVELQIPKPKVTVSVRVVMFAGTSADFSVDVPTGSSLLEALEQLSREDTGFTFEKESSLWGPFLSSVNGEQARQSDRRYWHLSADGAALSQGVRDYKIETPQKIVIRNTGY